MSIHEPENESRPREAPDGRLGESTFTAGVRPAEGLSTSRRWAPWAAVLVVVVGVLLALWAIRLSGSPEVLLLPRPGSMALLPIVEISGDRESDWVEHGLTEMLGEALAATVTERIVPTARLRRAILSSAPEGDAESWSRIAHGLGARYAVASEIGRDGDAYLARMTVRDAQQAVASVELKAPDLMSLADAMLFSLAKGLSSNTEPEGLGGLFSRRATINRFYGMGVSALRSGDARTATALLETCLRYEPELLRAEARLAESLAASGEGGARERYQQLLERASVRGEEELAAQASAALGRFAAAAGDYEEADELTARAREAFLALERSDAELEALEHQARIARTRGRENRAEELYFDLLQSQQALGDRLGQAETLTQLGGLALVGDDLEGGRSLLAEAEKISRELGDRRLEAAALASLGAAARNAGDQDLAAEHWRRALALDPVEGDERRRLLLLGGLAELAGERGDIAAEEEHYQELLTLAETTGDRPGQARALVELARIMLETGYPYQARSILDRVLTLDRWLSDRLPLQRVIAWVAYEAGNFKLAHETLSQARDQAGERWSEADQARLDVFRRAFEQGRRLPTPGSREASR